MLPEAQGAKTKLVFARWLVLESRSSKKFDSLIAKGLVT